MRRAADHWRLWHQGWKPGNVVMGPTGDRDLSIETWCLTRTTSISHNIINDLATVKELNVYLMI